GRLEPGWGRELRRGLGRALPDLRGSEVGCPFGAPHGLGGWVGRGTRLEATGPRVGLTEEVALQRRGRGWDEALDLLHGHGVGGSRLLEYAAGLTLAASSLAGSVPAPRAAAGGRSPGRSSRPGQPRACRGIPG